MKIRIGFVSNSSSASFIIDWKINTEACKADNNKERIARAVLSTMGKDIKYFDILNKSDPEKEEGWHKGYHQVFRDVIKSTTEVDEETGLYSSEFSTVMYNCPTDFRGNAGDLLTCLEISSISEKLRTRVVDNH